MISHAWISDFIAAEYKTAAGCSRQTCLNLGSGGESYGLPEDTILHVDLDSQRFSQTQIGLVADIQRLPSLGAQFDICLCVGSVLNHCDAAAVISGIRDALKPGGKLILEFESSTSLELLFSRHFNRSATVISTFYQDRTIRLWAYSERYVTDLLSNCGFAVIRKSSRHHLSPFAYLVCRNSNLAARFHIFDAIARHVPLLSRCASHFIYACQKTL
jgi:SAM-dependent methyltransferase